MTLKTTDRYRALVRPTLAFVIVGGLVCAAAALVLFSRLAGEVREGEMRPFDLRMHTVIYQQQGQQSARSVAWASRFR